MSEEKYQEKLLHLYTDQNTELAFKLGSYEHSTELLDSIFKMFKNIRKYHFQS